MTIFGGKNEKQNVLYLLGDYVRPGGGVILAGTIDYAHLPEQARLWSFAIASAAFFLTYFLDGTRKWGWLFPAFTCAALALTLGTDLGSMRGAWLTVAAILASLALPFYIGFALDHKRGGCSSRPTFTFVTIIITTDALIAQSILRTGGASKFLMAFSSGAGMFMLALPFFVTYFWSKVNWWALIPAGGFTSLGLMILLQFLVPEGKGYLFGVFIGGLLLGLAATLGVLWLSRKTQPTDWARFPAVGLFVGPSWLSS